VTVRKAVAALAIAGIYGVFAGSFAERTRDFGVRTALGATPGNIVRMIVRQGGALATAGTIAGLLGSVALSRFLRSLLFEVAPNDPVTVVGVAVLLGGVALIACLVPATRAAGLTRAAR
jgi:ABC-type antimicrobial peptide transport system permease subunit